LEQNRYCGVNKKLGENGYDEKNERPIDVQGDTDKIPEYDV
jgi:hypothetical protein